MNQDGPDPARHAPLLGTVWNADGARSVVQEIIDDAEAHLRPHGLWPAHPQDDNLPDDAACLYMGGAGVVWALDHLRRHGFRVELDLPALLPRIRDAHRAEARRFGQYAALPSLLMGDVGLLLLEMRLAGSDAAAERLGSRVAEACYLPVRELMWGLPGAMIACLDAHRLTGEARWRDLFRSAAARLLGDLRDSEWGPIWVQDLYGKEQCWLGPVHGYAGNLAPLLRGWAWLDAAQQAAVAASMRSVLPATARRLPQGTTWPAIAGRDAPARLVQHCHGAPGMVTTLAAGPVRLPEVEPLLLEAGELTWRAGPLAKGSNLCHGTGGNGYAFLRLWRHTGKAVWLDRARAFAMTAIAQCREARDALGHGRFTLWTGDPGLAIYLWACLEGEAGFPTVDL